MTVVDPKEGAAGPVLGLLELGLYNVQNNGYSILVVVPDNPLMGVCSIRGHYTVALAGELRRLIGLYKLHYCRV